jgi:hypothetical protein
VPASNLSALDVQHRMSSLAVLDTRVAMQLTSCRVIAVACAEHTLTPFSGLPGDRHSQTVFIESNQQDTETSKLTKLALNGSAADTFDVSKIKKVEDDH